MSKRGIVAGYSLHCCSQAAPRLRSIPPRPSSSWNRRSCARSRCRVCSGAPGAGPFPAIVLLHSCNGNWQRARRALGPADRTLGLCHADRRQLWAHAASTNLHEWFARRHGLRRLSRAGFPGAAACGRPRPRRRARILAGRLARAELGRARRRRTFLANKFRAAAAFYPQLPAVQGNLTVPALIMIGELDDWTSAEGCQQLAEGGDDYGVSRRREGAPIKLIVYPGRLPRFDSPTLKTPRELLGHHLEYNQAAAEQSAVALREFLDAMLRAKESGK